MRFCGKRVSLLRRRGLAFHVPSILGNEYRAIEDVQTALIDLKRQLRKELIEAIEKLIRNQRTT